MAPQAQVLLVMRRLQEEFGTAIILITHDLGVIADVADDVVVMYAGAAMEKADRYEIFGAAHHPYTEGLLRSLPAYGGERERRPLAIHKSVQRANRRHDQINAERDHRRSRHRDQQRDRPLNHPANRHHER